QLLLSRYGVNESNWWLLSEERNWQWAPLPKLVSAYFGQQGSFAYDDTGEFVVVQGYAWQWRPPDERKAAPDIEVDPIDSGFHETLLPWSYLATFNSSIFQMFTSFFCPRLKGGQFNYSPRFVERVFVPDLSDDQRVAAGTITGLARIGQAMHAGKRFDQTELDRLSVLAYG